MYAALTVKGVDQYDESMDKVEARAKKAAEAVAKVGHALLGLGAALTGMAALAVKQAADFETLKTRLTSLTGSVEKGAEAFRELERVAATTPYSLQAVVEAGAKLAAFMGEDTDAAIKLTKNVADLAAFMGVDVTVAADAFGRAMAGGRGAAEMLRNYGILKLIDSFHNMQTGTKLAADDVMGFRKALMDFVTSEVSPIAGSTDRLAKTFSGAMSNFKDAVARLAAQFGDVLLPSITKVTRALTGMVEKLEKMPPFVRDNVVQVGALTGSLALLAGGLMSLLPKMLEFTASLRTLQTVLGSAKVISLGGIGILGALAAMVYLMRQIDISSRGAGQAARDIAEGGGKDLQDRLTLLEGKLAKAKQSYGENAAVVRVYEQAIASLREQLGGLAEEEMPTVESRAAKLTEEERRALFDFDAAEQWALTQERIKEGALAFLRGVESVEEGLEGVLPNLDLSLLHLKKTGDETAKLGEVARQSAAAISGAFSDMARGIEVNVGQMLIQIGLLIAKLLILKVLEGPLGGAASVGYSIVSGIFSGLFDTPVMDTKAFRWGFDFLREFRNGINSSLTGGLGLPSLQPAAMPAGSLAGSSPMYEVHIHEPGPDTYVKVVRKGLAAMGESGRFGLMRSGLGKAYDDWAGR